MMSQVVRTSGLLLQKARLIIWLPSWMSQAQHAPNPNGDQIQRKNKYDFITLEKQSVVREKPQLPTAHFPQP